MTILRPRSRTISIRLSEDEFSNLQQICVTTRARSVSDLARSAMHEFLEMAKQETASAPIKDELKSQLEALYRRVDELARQVAVFEAQRPADNIAQLKGQE